MRFVLRQAIFGMFGIERQDAVDSRTQADVCRLKEFMTSRPAAARPIALSDDGPYSWPAGSNNLGVNCSRRGSSSAGVSLEKTVGA
jgi:hypothetical protein